MAGWNANETSQISSYTNYTGPSTQNQDAYGRNGYEGVVYDYGYPSNYANFFKMQGPYGSTATTQHNPNPGLGSTNPAALGTANPQHTASHYAGYEGGTYDYGYPSNYANLFKMQGAYGSIGAATTQNSSTPGLSSANATALGATNPNTANHFSGYEAAVFAAASSYLQAKNTGQSNKWMKSGGPPRTNNITASSGGFQKKRYGLGHANREIQNIYCEVCKITCGGQQTYKEHIDGKAHKKKEALNNGQNKQNLPRNKVSFKCDICNVTCTGRDTYDAHAKGSRHIKTVALLRKLNKPILSLEPTVIPPKEPPIPPIHQMGNAMPRKVVGVTGTKFIAGSKLSTTNALDEPETNIVVEQALLAESNVKPVGEEFIEDIRDANGKLLQYNCKLCDCKFSDPNAKEIHLKGRRHRVQYKTKVNPELQIEFKSNNQWRKREQNLFKPYFAQQQAYYFICFTYIFLFSYRQPMVGPPPHLRSYFYQMNQLTPAGYYESSDDRHVLAKDEAIRLTNENSTPLENLVTLIERTLKSISDLFAEEEKKSLPIQEAPKTDTENSLSIKPNTLEEQERLLKGVMRVGLLAKNLLLNIDKEASEELALNVVEKKEESCLFVTVSNTPISVRITLTSVLVREAENSTGGNATAIESPPSDALPIKYCLNALAELRRAKWFQIKCLPLQSSVVVLRIIRDIGYRIKTWAPLSTWVC